MTGCGRAHGVCCPLTGPCGANVDGSRSAPSCTTTSARPRAPVRRDRPTRSGGRRHRPPSGGAHAGISTRDDVTPRTRPSAPASPVEAGSNCGSCRRPRLCNELSQSHRVEVKFHHFTTCRMVFPRTSACALYRIVQEALAERPASTAHRPLVVDLRRGTGGIRLQVTTRGPGSSRVGPWQRRARLVIMVIRRCA